MSADSPVGAEAAGAKRARTFQKGDDAAPFNVLLSLIVAIDMLANAASFTLVFPFQGFMVMDVTGCSPSEAGYYAGWLASSIMVGRAISAVPWGWVSDRWGRVPVMVVGNAGISVCAALFGLSKSLGWAIGTRTLMGIISGGLVGTAKVCIGELFPEAHQPQAMGVLGSTWGVGILIGPILGGWLSRPFGRLPPPVGSLELFRTFPYLLPCLALSLLSATSALVTQLYLPETLPRRTVARVRAADGGRVRRGFGHVLARRSSHNAVKRRGAGTGKPLPYAQLQLEAADDAECAPAAAAAAAAAAADEEAEGRPEAAPGASPTRSPAARAARSARAPRWYLERPFLASVVVYFGWSFAMLMLDETVALFALATLGFSAAQIGSASGLCGLPLIAFQLLAFPRIVGRLGARGALIAFGLVTAPAALIIPLSAQFTGGARWALLVGGMVTKTCLASAGFTALFIVTNNAVVQAHRGVANGMGTVVSAIAKALGPVVGGPVFAWSIRAAAAQDADEAHEHRLTARERFGHFSVFALTAALCLLTAALMACSPASLDRRRDGDPSTAPLSPAERPDDEDDHGPHSLPAATWNEVELKRRSRS